MSPIAGTFKEPFFVIIRLIYIIRYLWERNTYLAGRRELHIVITAIAFLFNYQVRFDALFFNEIISSVSFTSFHVIIQFDAIVCRLWYMNTAVYGTKLNVIVNWKKKAEIFYQLRITTTKNTL